MWLDPSECTIFRGIPVTTPARTLLALAAVLSTDDLARACHEAGVKWKTTPAEITALLAGHKNAPGAGRLTATATGKTRITLSRLEKRFLQLLRKHALPLPQTNRPAGTYRVDCRWPEHRLTVELDSYAFHNSRHAFEQDRRREREAYARGDDFRRYTWGDVVEAPAPLLAELRSLLPALS